MTKQISTSEKIRIAIQTTQGDIQKAIDRLGPMDYPKHEYDTHGWVMSDKLSINSIKKCQILSHLLDLDPRFKFYTMAGLNTIAFEVNKEEIRIATHLPQIQHEVAHWVEMNDPKRWLLPNWDLTTFHSGDPTPRQFFAALSREIRVRAIQTHLLKTKDEESGLRNILNHGYWSQYSLPFGKFKTREQVQEWVFNLFNRTYNAWSKDRIEAEFKIRLQAAQEWMEKKEDQAAA